MLMVDYSKKVDLSDVILRFISRINLIMIKDKPTGDITNYIGIYMLYHGIV